MAQLRLAGAADRHSLMVGPGTVRLLLATTLAIAGVALWAGQAGVVVREEVCGIARLTVVVLSSRSLLNEHSIGAGTLPGLACLVPEEVPGIARAAVVILRA